MYNRRSAGGRGNRHSHYFQAVGQHFIWSPRLKLLGEGLRNPFVLTISWQHKVSNNTRASFVE